MAITDLYVSSTGTTTPYTSATSAGSAMSFSTFNTAMSAGSNLAGYRFNLLAGTYSQGATTLTWSSFGSLASPLIVRGYGTTIGDGYQGRTSGWGALKTTNMPAITFSGGNLNVTGNKLILESLQISGNGGFSVPLAVIDHTVVKSCSITTNSTVSRTVSLSGSFIQFLDCDISQTASSGSTVQAVNLGVAGSDDSTLFYGCHITSKTSAGVYCNGGLAFTFERCLVYGCGTYGILQNNTASSLRCFNNTIVGNGSDGIYVVSTNSGNQFSVGNVITDNGGYAINCGNTSDQVVMFANYTRNNTNGAFGNNSDWVAYTNGGSYGNYDPGTTGSAYNDYVSQSSGNYTLASNSPALTMNSSGLTLGAQVLNTIPGCFGVAAGGGGVPLIGEGLVF